ncbi:MAG: hypothetical protein QM501_11150 [Gimesia sp.]
MRWLATMALTLGICPFAVAEDPVTKTDPFLSNTETAQTWEELKTRSAEKRWESISRENKREVKKQNRRSRKEQRKSSKGAEGIEFVPQFRQIPDEAPAPSVSSEIGNSLPATTEFNTRSTQISNSPITKVAPDSELLKTVGLEEKQADENTSTSNINAKGTVESTNQIVPIFPSTNGSGSKFVTTQKTYEDLAASPLSGDGILSEDDLEDEVPHLLKKIGGINPFFDYEPDPEIAKKEPCRNLCPRPDGKPCKIIENNGETILQCPKEYQLSHEPYAGRNFTESIYTWEASNLHYNPLYFEDPNLERYGNSRRDLVQPFVSMGRFTGQLLALPYQMSIDPIRKEIYPLGYYRPGEITPKRISGIPWNTKAAITQGLTVTGLAFLLP